MALSEFRWNKKRKHYAYLFKKMGLKRMNMLISTKPYVYRKGKRPIKNIPLFRHPNLTKSGKYYLIPRNYLDDCSCFEDKVYQGWEFDANDRRNVKRIKKNKYIQKKKKSDRSSISANHRLIMPLNNIV